MLLAAGQQKAKFIAEAHVTEPCWDENVGSQESECPDSRTENCITSYAECFTNTLTITGQFAQNVQEGGP